MLTVRSPTNPASGSTLPAADLDGARPAVVLVVEDDVKLCRLICGVLERRRIAAPSVGTGDAALLAVASERPDAVVLDIMIPHPDGIEVARQLRRDGWTGPLVMISARDTPEDHRRALDAGADRFLAKPFALVELARSVTSLLGRPDGRVEHHLPHDRTHHQEDR